MNLSLFDTVAAQETQPVQPSTQYIALAADTGITSSHWRTLRFDAITIIGTGQVSPLVEPYRSYPYVGPENIEAESGAIIGLKTSLELGLISGKYLFDADAIVYSKIRPNLNKVCTPGFVGVCSADAYPIWAKKDVVTKGYLAHFMRSDAFVKQAVAASMRSGMPKVNREDIAPIKVLLPPLPEQRRIVEILDEADAAVRTTDALITAKRKLKHAWAERLLTGRVRFSEFAGEAWQTRHLGEFFRDRNVRYKGEMPPLVLSCSKIHGIVPQTDLFSRVLASKDLGRYKFVEPGDLVFDPMLLWDASINFSTRTGVVSPAYSTLQFVAADADPRFFHYLFDSHALRHVYKTISQGTNTRRKKATAADFLRIAVSLPALPEQRKIAEVLSLMDEELRLLRRQLAAFKAQKQGLMQKLLTGEVRTHLGASGDPPETGR